MDDFLLLWISLSLTFYSAMKSQCFPLSFHIPCLEKKHTLILFSTTATLFCQLLKKMEIAIAGKDVSKEIALAMNVTTTTALLWFTLLKALFLRWHRARATSSHNSEDWEAACPHGNCSLLPSTRCSMTRVLSAYSIQSPTGFVAVLQIPRFGWIVSDSADSYHVSPCLFFCRHGKIW